MEESLRRKVCERADGRCEYCQLPQHATVLPHEVDHIIAQKHSGSTILENLCLACYYCNAYKGPNIAGVDPDTQEVTRLYHPGQEPWEEHFLWDGPILVGRTPIGRTTFEVLRINLPERATHRKLLIAEGIFPPSG
jgi:HNH endonuclease